MQNISQAAGNNLGARSRDGFAKWKRRRPKPCPSRPALLPNCQMNPLPFTSQCGALGSAIEQAIEIDTSEAKHVLCRTDILSQERAPGGRCAARRAIPHRLPHPTTQQQSSILLVGRAIDTHVLEIDPNSSTPPTKSEERSIEQPRERNRTSSRLHPGYFMGGKKRAVHQFIRPHSGNKFHSSPVHQLIRPHSGNKFGCRPQLN